jgi:hypothetical protein
MKKNTSFFLIILISTITLKGCSWVEYFIVKNNTKSKVSISYHLNENNTSAFNIFNQTPTIYQLNEKGNINWDKKLSINDKDKSFYDIKLNLPPKCVLIFGHLNNDIYSNKDQHFINGRTFNFSKMEIEQKNDLIIITLETFDDFFKKEKGEITYEIQ